MARLLAVVLVTRALTALSSGTDPWYPYVAKKWATSVSSSDPVCLGGVRQSPINFDQCYDPLEQVAPEISWPTAATVQLVNNGHTVTVRGPQYTAGSDATTDMSFITAGEKISLYLMQCHFHFGSEHTVGGKQFVFETHCVHGVISSNENQRYGVFGAFFEVGAASTFLGQIEDVMPTHSASVNARRMPALGSNLLGEPMDGPTLRRLSGTDAVSTYTGPFNYSQLATEVNLTHYWEYDGSFTTPPCTEAVTFLIFMNPATLSQAQLTKFKDAIGWKNAPGNFRPPQTTYSREIHGCTTKRQPHPNEPWYPYEAPTWAMSVGSDSNSVCKGGSQQSPIDFHSCATPTSRGAVGITWQTQTVDLINNGHTVQLTAKGTNKGRMTVGEKTYGLLQCHFHWSSEHTVGGKAYPFETHCVHQQETGEEAKHYGVFGQFYEIGQENAFLKTFEDELPSSDGRRLQASIPSLDTAEYSNLFGELMTKGADRRLAGGGSTSTWHGPVNFKALYGTNSRTKYWDYPGSFTTPPCTEAVDFYIMMTPATLTELQLAKFKVAIGWRSSGGNFRPPQMLGTRVVSGCERIANTEFLAQQAAQKIIPELAPLIREEMRAEIKAVLEEEQGSHGDMKIALVVLSVALVPLVFVTLGVAFLLFKTVRGAPQASEQNL